MVYDHLARRLRFVAVTFAELETIFDQGFVSGEGCAGFAFEKTRTLFYFTSKDTLRFFIQPKEWPGEGLIDEEAVISVPWVYRAEEATTDTVTVGVLNIGSRDPGSDLFGFADLDKAGQEEAAKELIALTATMGSAIFDLIKVG